VKKHENSENLIFNPHISHFEDCSEIFTLFWSFYVLDQAQGALRDLKQIFLTEYPRLVKKNSAPRKSTAHIKKHENHENLIFDP